jgi:hypothetical protein
MNKKAVVSIVVVVVLAFVALGVVYAHNLYQMFLRVHNIPLH